MNYDDEIRKQIRMDFPKIVLYDGQEYQAMREAYTSIVHNPISLFTKSLNVDLTYEDTDELILHRKMTKKTMTFFLNYLQNENLLKGEELSKKIYFGLLNVKIYNEDGNLEYDAMDQMKRRLILPTYVSDIFDELIITVMDLKRWYSIYINKEKKMGYMFDFKNDGKVDIHQNLDVLNEIIQQEFHFEIVDYDIKVLAKNVNIDTDGGYFLINIFNKFIQGAQITELNFTTKEQSILKERLDWILLKTKEHEDNLLNQTKFQKPKESRIQAGLDDADDIILDESVHKNQTTINQQNRVQNQRVKPNAYKYDQEEDYQTHSVINQQHSFTQNRQSAKVFRQGRNATKLLTIAPRNDYKSSKQQDLLESFDYRDDSDLKPVETKKYIKNSRKVSYQESNQEDVEQLWNFGNEDSRAKKRQTPLKKIDDVEEHLNRMWDFKESYKKGMRQRNNYPVLIPEDQKQYYKQRQDQTSEQRDMQDKIIDILVFLEKQESPELLNNPTLSQNLIIQKDLLTVTIILLFFDSLSASLIVLYNNSCIFDDNFQLYRFAVSRLKEKLGIGGQEGLKGKDGGENVKVKNINELKKKMKEEMMSKATEDLDQLLEKQNVLHDMLDNDEDDRKNLERRFEREIQAIDSYFQKYMQKYDSLNQFENLQQMYRNAFRGPPAEQVGQIKNSMHVELQNYLLSGLGLPSKFTSNPQYFESVGEAKFNSSAIPISRNADTINANFNQSAVFEKRQQKPSIGIGKNQSMISLDSGKGSDGIPKKRQILGNESSKNSENEMLKESPHSDKEKQKLSKDTLCFRYGVCITQKNLIDILTVDKVEIQVIRFLLAYLEEKFFAQNKLDAMIKSENRILLYPIEFYSILSCNNPLVKQQQLNFRGVEIYTSQYVHKHTIFDEFDKLVFPLLLVKPQLYALAVADLNVRQIIFFSIVKGSLKIKHNNVNQGEEDEINLDDYPLKNPVCLNLIKYLEKEYSNKFLRNFQILNWSFTNISCGQTSSPTLSPYYLLLYVSMIYNQEYKFKKVTANKVKEIKLWIPEVFKTVGITQNDPKDMSFFVPIS